MHCPKCGQQQVLDEMRFCSRCGFALGIVTELILTGGTLPERETESFAARLSGRKRGKRFGLLLCSKRDVCCTSAECCDEERVEYGRLCCFTST